MKESAKGRLFENWLCRGLLLLPNIDVEQQLDNAGVSPGSNYLSGKLTTVKEYTVVSTIGQLDRKVKPYFFFNNSPGS